MTTRLRRHQAGAVLIVASFVLASGCSLKKMAVNSVAGMLSESGATFSSDDDPELVRDAVPFALKLYESLLESVPEHRGLLLATCSVFTQYGYAFVQTDAEAIEPDDFAAALTLSRRAFKLYVRGRDYCLRALELRQRGVTVALDRQPETALAWARVEDVELLYWTGASWGSAIAASEGRPSYTIDVPAVRALLERAIALDETFQHGALHAAMISLAALPETMGGSPDEARRHFERAVALSKGQDPGPYVTLAASVSVATGNRAEFVQLLQTALAIDPEANPETRLPTLITQERARRLLARVDDLFYGTGTTWRQP